VPETWVQVVVVLASVVPGFVYQVSRRQVAGPDPEHRELGTRVLYAIAATAMFASVYALCLGDLVRGYVRSPDRALDDVQALGVYFAVFAIAIPWTAARAWYYAVTSPAYRAAAAWLAGVLHVRRAWDPTPSAWDFAFNQGTAGWVRVRFADGRFLGGWFGERSFASSFPNPQEIFVEVGYVINSDGTFTTTQHAPGGMMIRCADAVPVDFVPLLPDTGGQDDQGGGA